MTKTILIEDLVVGQFYKIPSGKIFKVEHLSWHADGGYKGQVEDLILVAKDGSKKHFGFLSKTTTTNFIAIVDGFEMNENEIENEKLRKALEFYANDDNWLPTDYLPLDCSHVELDKGKVARKALEVTK